jgi:uncharacterized protein YndB with AHSA1/START domain
LSLLRTEPGADPIIVECRYPVSRQRVYEAWTNPDHVRQWFGTQSGDLYDATVELRPGGRWRFTEHLDENGSTGFEGEYVEVTPNELLVFTWRKFTVSMNGMSESTLYSTVRIAFRDAVEGSSMQIVHSNLDSESGIGFRAGWASGAASLAAFLGSPIHGPSEV